MNSTSNNPHASLPNYLLVCPSFLVVQPQQKSLHASVLDGVHPDHHHLSRGMLYPLQEHSELALSLLLVPHTRARIMGSHYGTKTRQCGLRSLGSDRRRVPRVRFLWDGPGCYEGIQEGPPQAWIRTFLSVIAARA